MEFVNQIGVQDVLVGDFDGDGHIDVATVNNGGSHSVTVFRNTSSGGSVSLVSAVTVIVGSIPSRGTVGDVDGNGKPDLVIANAGSNSVSVLRNTSTGPGAISFSVTTVAMPTNSGLTQVKLGDVNGDGKLDMYVPETGDSSSSTTVNNKVAVFLGDGAGGFGTAQEFQVGSGPTWIAAADVNGDGRLDLITTDDGSKDVPGNSISVLFNTTPRGQSSLTFNRQVWQTGTSMTGLATGDFDKNGLPDMLTVGPAGGGNVYYAVMSGLVHANTIQIVGPANVQAGVAFPVNISAALQTGGVDPRNSDTISFTYDENTDIPPSPFQFHPPTSATSRPTSPSPLSAHGSSPSTIPTPGPAARSSSTSAPARPRPSPSAAPPAQPRPARRSVSR